MMDDPSLDPAAHAQALRGLVRINWWSASPRILWPPLRSWMRRHGRRKAKVLDVATGAGDVPVALWRLARHAGFDLEIAGCDASAQAVACARQRAAQLRAPLETFVMDATAQVPPPGFDIITCSLFLHHLEESDAITVMRRMAAAAGGLVMVNDLIRSRAGLVLAYAGTRLLSRSPIVHADGPRSVHAAFTVEEARALAAQAGWRGATVRRRWPCRFLVTWQKA